MQFSKMHKFKFYNLIRIKPRGVCRQVCVCMSATLQQSLTCLTSQCHREEDSLKSKTEMFEYKRQREEEAQLEPARLTGRAHHALPPGQMLVETNKMPVF